MTVDRKCGSSEAAIHAAVGAIAAGALDIVVAGGVESMSRVPMGANRAIHGEVFGWRVTDRFTLTSQGEAAERIADRWDLTRDHLDDYAMESHRRAASASDGGYFDGEIAPISPSDWAERGATAAVESLKTDETIRRDTSRQRLSTLKTSFREENGRITAGNSSQISDGAAALLLMSRRRAQELGLRPLAHIRSIATVGSDPELMLLGPIAATKKVLQRAGLSIRDVDLFEVNEAFAPVPLVWLRELGASHEKLNVNGGAIALGHPLGASGARIMTSLVHEMQRRDAHFGLQSICCAGGLGTATILERI
jgi:acetyl-CoA acetyltransferase family protein